MMEALPQAWVSQCIWEGQSHTKVVLGFPTRAVVFRLQLCYVVPVMGEA